jgi:hypothetical protein
MIPKIRCANPRCRRLFLPDPRVKTQRYCSRKECQRLRKRRWQREKMETDRDYRLDQKESRQCWSEQNRDYSRRYRANHPEYVQRNRLLQRGRDQRRRDNLAKMDAISSKYLLIPNVYPFLAKKDSIDCRPFHGLVYATKEVAAHDGKNHRSSRAGP